MNTAARSATRLRPQRWTPPPAPARAKQKVSTPPLPPVRRIELPGPGPEDVVRGADGAVYTGLATGEILRVEIDTAAVTEVADTGGRPLGLHARQDGSLLVCDAERGLLHWPGPGRPVEVLVDAVDGDQLAFASNVIEDPADATIYFTASSTRWPLSQWLGDIFEHTGTGRLLRRTPAGAVDTLLDDLQFANGVAFAPDGASLIVAETAAYRLSRYWLHGPKSGTRETLVDNLPGFPDNIALGSDGLIWVTLVSPRNSFLDSLLPRPGFLRTAAWALPDRWKPAPVRTAWVLGVDAYGSIVHDLQRDGTDYAVVTGVVEHEGTLILGSLHESAIAVTRVPA
ncbi:SMP-30/gluconolactonase/LRE family protein [Nocardia flavorosea]|uniref:SMP-30/gluconolactonase/LRE family protein n=1 Tax=Nocardia flavorosea TaxID=53429 RepID=A0A846YFK2_9NOCA|nr:SMP-30/gluconolactonase/LRE family protein [Nocardia flavorosea]NKY56452.1 SMP-30/gluconolactonase/LRE family protein [Nocardia flavorosea]